jgi:hypothetical protein
VSVVSASQCLVWSAAAEVKRRAAGVGGIDRPWGTLGRPKGRIGRRLRRHSARRFQTVALFLEVEFVMTLMRLTEIGYVESGDRSFGYYYAVPDRWADLPDLELQKRAYEVATRIYEEHARRFRAAEPNDLNYLLVKRTRTRKLADDEALAWPWLKASPPVWESTPCFVVHADGSHERMDPVDFANALPLDRPTA